MRGSSKKRKPRLSLKDRAVRIAEMVRKLAMDNLNANWISDVNQLNVYDVIKLQEAANEVAYEKA